MTDRKSKTKEYVNVSGQARQIAAGPMLAPGASSSMVNLTDPADKALIDEGHLVLKEDK